MGSDDLCVNWRRPLQSGMQSDPPPSMLTPKKMVGAGVRTRDTFSAQTPLMIIGLAAISMILLINSHARPAPSRAKAVAYACAECGTVVAVRRATDAAASWFIEIQMLDGSLRTIEQPVAQFHIGDIVRVNGSVLKLRSAAS